MTPDEYELARAWAQHRHNNDGIRTDIGMQEANKALSGFQRELLERICGRMLKHASELVQDEHDNHTHAKLDPSLAYINACHDMYDTLFDVLLELGYREDDDE